MGIDFFVELPCEPRKQLGEGNVEQGSARILELLKARTFAGQFEQLAARDGKSPDSISVTRVVDGPNGPVKTQLTYAAVKAQAARLNEHAEHCKTCPANMTQRPYGCVGYVQYPITEAAERWLIDRVQPVGTVGGELLQSMIRDFSYDGAPIRPYRERQLMAARTPPAKVVKKGMLSSTKVDANQIWQAFLAVGSRLAPAHCLCMLAALGSISLDGQVPGPVPRDANLLATLNQLPPGERGHRAQAAIDRPSADESTFSVQLLLLAAYTAYATNSPVGVDA